MSRRALMTLFQLHLSDDGANREDCIIDLFEFEWDEWVWPLIKDVVVKNAFHDELLFKDEIESARNNLLNINSVKNKLLDEYKKDFKSWYNVSWEAIENEIDRHIINRIKEK